MPSPPPEPEDRPAAVIDIAAHVNLLADQVHALRDDGRRVLLAITGAPGSGKSTLAEELARRLRLQRVATTVVPMDGFHLDNGVLEPLGLLSRKGAPETFDAAGFVHMVSRIKRGETVYAPVFDRPRDIAIAGARTIAGDCPVVVFEGNYLLMQEAPWDQLLPLWDLSAWLEVDLPDLRARLIQRWLSHGLSRAAATRRAEGNDLKNAERIQQTLGPADIVLR